MPCRILIAALLALPALGAPALAQNRQCQSACRQEAQRSSGPDPVHICAIRCAAADAFLRQERSRPARPVRLPAPAPDGFGVILAAPAPSASFGLAVGTGDRMSAWRLADQHCRGRSAACRLVTEFSAACGAVAQGIRRSPGALFVTSDPGTYAVTSTHGGSAADRAGAEADALAVCRAQDPRATCRIVAVQCRTGRG